MLRFLLEKEFKQIMRNSFVPRIIIFMPIMMMLVLPWAANQEIKNVKLSVVDHDRSTYSERLIQKITSSGYFTLTDFSPTGNEAMKSIESGDADIILEIEDDFEGNLVKEGSGKVMISSNAVNGVKAGLGSSYLAAILTDFSTDLRTDAGVQMAKGAVPSFSVMPQYKFNPHLDYKVFMVPALMVMLLTILGGFLPALNIVGEKEAGTIEQINVTPVGKMTFVLGKLIPYWCIGFVVLIVCMSLAVFVYGLFPQGSFLTVCLFASIYVLALSGMGLVISNYSDTMQQAMFVMFFFILIFNLMSGLFTPVSSMPDWAQTITLFNPLKYFVDVMRLIYLKGSGFLDLTTPFFALCGFAAVFNVWAVRSYRKNN